MTLLWRSYIQDLFGPNCSITTGSRPFTVISATFFCILDEDNTIIQNANHELMVNANYSNNLHKLPDV